MIRLDSSTIYQIFWLSHTGFHKYEIARQLGIARNTVTSHLDGIFAYHYPHALRVRISRLSKPKKRRREIPEGFISIAESSYFFQKRPTVKTILAHYRMETRVLNGCTFTTKEWAKEYAQTRNKPGIEGVCITRKAARYLYGIKPRFKITRLSEVDSSDTPAALVHAAIQIQRWTQMPFITLDIQDVLRYADPI